MKKLDIIVLISFPLFATILSLSLKFNFLLHSIVFFILPSIYLTLRTKNALFRNLIFVLPFSLITGIIAGYIFIFNKYWIVPTIFPFKILSVTVEELIWYISAVYFSIVFYEHFEDNQKHKLLDKHLKNLAIILIIFTTLFILALYFNPSLLYISHFYFKVELVLIVSSLFILIKYPSLLYHLFKVSLYNIIVSILYLLLGIKFGNWVYTGDQFVGWTKIFDLAVPFEELLLTLIFWLVMIELFELFDDRKHLV